jgi:hypothetical protein
MKMTITNTSRAPQGVHSVSGLVFIDPGKTREVDVAESYVDRVKALKFFTLGTLDHDGDGKKGGAAPNVPPSERDILKAKAADLKLEFPKNIATDKLKLLVRDAELDAMSDTELKTLLGDKGVTTTDETREQLLELAKAE